jgi:pSer/pThr/pTyr-binding forkhead associated (FHA) protein
MPKLVFTDPNFAGKVYPLTVEKTTVGRGDENLLTIRDASLSARHCEILANGTEVIVRDLGSRNGTMVDGRLLKNQQSAVKHGQMVRFGLVDARVEIEPPSRLDDTDPETAVFDHRQILREQRRAQKNPVPADPSVKFDSAAKFPEGNLGPRTILVPEPAPVPKAPSSNDRASDGAEQKMPAYGKTWLWTALIAVAVLLAAWLIWGRK